jgi:hypothetical protein
VLEPIVCKFGAICRVAERDRPRFRSVNSARALSFPKTRAMTENEKIPRDDPPYRDASTARASSGKVVNAAPLTRFRIAWLRASAGGGRIRVDDDRR